MSPQVTLHLTSKQAQEKKRKEKRALRFLGGGGAEGSYYKNKWPHASSAKAAGGALTVGSRPDIADQQLGRGTRGKRAGQLWSLVEEEEEEGDREEGVEKVEKVEL